MTHSTLILVDGTPKSGIGSLSEMLWLDVPIPLVVPKGTSFEELRASIAEADQGPILVPRLLITAACRLSEANEPGCEPCNLLAEQWAALDYKCEKRGARLITLLDTPVAIEARMPEWERDAWPRERIARWLQTVNTAANASSLRRKGTYSLKQFLSDPSNSESKTDQYHRLVEVIRREIGVAP